MRWYRSHSATGLLATILITAMCCGSAWGADPEADLVFDQANAWYKRERWSDAISEYRKFLTNWPEDNRGNTARLYLGFAELNTQEYKSARRNLRQFAQAVPQSRNLGQVLYRIAECSYLMDELPEARTEMRDFLTRFPDDSYAERALPYLGDIELRLGRFAQAMDQFQKAIDRFPKGELIEDCRFGLARSLEGIGKYPDAVRIYTELADNPTGTRGAEALLNLGARQFEDLDYKSSAASYEKLESRFPKSELLPLAHLNHGFALYRLTQYSDAIKHFELAAKDPEQKPAAELWKGLCHKALGDYEKAIQVFAASRTAFPKDPLNEDFVYQQADCEQRRGKAAVAQQLFMEVVTKWPQGNLADDSLHFAAVNALEQGKPAEAQTLLDRFAKEYPNSGLRWHHELLKGRLAMQTGKIPDALAVFQRVLQGSESETTRAWGRYYLAYLDYQGKKYPDAAQKCQELAEVLLKLPRERAETLSGVWILQSAVELELGKASTTPMNRKSALDRAEQAAARYLEWQPQGGQVSRAWGLRALAAVHAGDRDKATTYLTKLRQLGTQALSPDLPPTLHEIAEVAYSNQQWDDAGQLFENLTKTGDPRYQEKGLSGWGWCEFQKKNFAKARGVFEQLLKSSPKSELAPEARFMVAKSFEEEHKAAEAAEAYEAVLKAEPEGKFGFPAALQKARLLAELNKPEAAEQAYAFALEHYPNAPNPDKLLDEWASYNYRLKNYKKSDELFRRLAEKHPQSDLADNARLSIAESDLVDKKFDQARDQFRELVRSDRSDAGVKQAALYQLLVIGVEKSAWKEVREDAQALLQLAPDGKYARYARYRRGEAELNSSDAPAAIQTLRDLLARSAPATPETWFPQVWVLLAEAYFEIKDYPGLEKLAEETRTWNAESESAYLVDEVVARGRIRQNKFAEAREMLGRALKHPQIGRSEAAARSQFLIGETWLMQKDFTQAEKEYLKVDDLYKYPTWQARATFQAARCQEELKQPLAAIKSYESLLSRWPECPQAAEARQRLDALKAKPTVEKKAS